MSLSMAINLIPSHPFPSAHRCRVLGLGDEDSRKVFFPISEGHLERRICDQTCVLLISQSGQTFSTLHATHKLANIVGNNLWILTGCANSKMEFALVDSYRRNKIPYDNDRVILNLAGHRPAEPSSLAVAATWHTLTRLMLHLIFTTRALAPSGRIVHEWVFHKSARIIQTFFRRHNGEMRRLRRKNSSLHNLSLLGLEAVVGMGGGGGGGLFGSPRAPPARKSLKNNKNEGGRGGGGGGGGSFLPVAPSAVAAVQAVAELAGEFGATASCDTAAGSTREGEAYTKPVVLMRLTDGCIKDFNSLLACNLIPNVCAIVGRDIKGKLLDSNEIQSASVHFMSSSLAAFSNNGRRGGGGGSDKVSGAKAAGGASGSGTGGNSGGGGGAGSNDGPSSFFDQAGSAVAELFSGDERNLSVNAALVARGRAWAEHINESWKVLVLAGLYIFISVGFGLPIVGLLADAFIAVLRAMGAPMEPGKLIFSVRHPSTIYAQHPAWAVWGLIFQILDALFFIYVGKNMARLLRLVTGRPIYARFGKRTIVIVDNPTVHQLLENFVSKLYSQSYGIVGVDVHGASGLDHFVHRFTHRVVRGVLIAVGRPDGRLCCLGSCFI
jgi:uncharacterized membrane protein YgcG